MLQSNTMPKPCNANQRKMLLHSSAANFGCNKTMQKNNVAKLTCFLLKIASKTSSEGIKKDAKRGVGTFPWTKSKWPGPLGPSFFALLASRGRFGESFGPSEIQWGSQNSPFEHCSNINGSQKEVLEAVQKWVPNRSRKWSSTYLQNRVFWDAENH